MTYRILEYPKDADFLRRHARPIRRDEYGSDVLLAFASRLGNTMGAAHGMGLAATQVAEAPGGDPWRMFAMLAGKGYLVVCNPEITEPTAYEVGPEACLSFASVQEQVAAPTRLTLRFWTIDGEEHTTLATGLDARCIFHETGHLDGQLMIDRLSLLKRKLFMREVEKRYGANGAAAARCAGSNVA